MMELKLSNVMNKISPLDMNVSGSVDTLHKRLITINPNISSWGYDFENNLLTITFAEGYTSTGDFSSIGDVIL